MSICSDIAEDANTNGGITRWSASLETKPMASNESVVAELRKLQVKWRWKQAHDLAIDGGWGSHGTIGLGEAQCADELEPLIARLTETFERLDKLASEWDWYTPLVPTTLSETQKNCAKELRLILGDGKL